MPAKLGEALGMQDGDIVSPEVASGLPDAKQLHATVASVDDWEVVESNAEQLTKHLLEQVQVVRKGDTLPIWIRGQSSVNVVIQSAQPAAIVLLKNDTIVSIEPPQKNSKDSGNATNTANDIEPSSSISTDTKTRGDRMLADVLRPPQPAGIRGPVRLRVKVCPSSYSIPTCLPACHVHLLSRTKICFKFQQILAVHNRLGAALLATCGRFFQPTFVLVSLACSMAAIRSCKWA